MACQGVFQAGHTYVILADNGKYLSRITRGEVDYVEASIDDYSHFRASVLGDGKIALKAYDGGNSI